MKTKWVSSHEDWQADDPTVPRNWKVRYFEGRSRLGEAKIKCYLLSPDGEVFQSRVKALQFLLTQEPKDIVQVGEMVGVLGAENWVPHPLLPPDWRVRPGGPGPLSFLTPAGLVMGCSRALAHVEECPDYSLQTREGLLMVAKSFSMVKEEEKMMTGWKEDASLPPGWLVRPGLRGKKVEYLLSPQGVQVRGRLGAIQLLLREGKTAEGEEVQCLRAGFLLLGWQEDNQLPPGWLRKKSSKSSNLLFLSPEYREFCGLDRVYHHLKARHCHPSVLGRLGEQLSVKRLFGNRRANNKSGSRWKEEPGLPPGWKVAVRRFKYKKHPKEFFLSPSGLQLPLAVLALQLMVEEGVADTALPTMLPRIEREGWKEEAGLPAGWRINLDPTAAPEIVKEFEELPEVLLLSRRAQILALPAAIKQLQEEEGYVKEDLKDLDNIINYLKYEQPEPVWTEDKSLPQHWRLWREEQGHKVRLHVRTPQGERLGSLGEAFVRISESQGWQSREEVEGMSRLLSEEGWESSDKLPQGWLICRRKGDLLFQLLTREGRMFDTLHSAQEWMGEKGDEEYTMGEQQELEKLCLDEVKTYLATRGDNRPYGGDSE